MIVNNMSFQSIMDFANNLKLPTNLSFFVLPYPTWIHILSKRTLTYERTLLLFLRLCSFCDIFLSLTDKRPLLNYQIEPKYQMEPNVQTYANLKNGYYSSQLN